MPALFLRQPEPFVMVRQTLGLYQDWTMLALHPEMNDLWPVIVGQLRDGSIVDVHERRLGAPSAAKPEVVSAVYANYRWRKFLSNLEDQSYLEAPQRLALNYARYLCGTWNADAPPERQLTVFRIDFQVEWTPPPGEAKQVVTRPVWAHDCFG